jgi:hypothetical protein
LLTAGAVLFLSGSAYSQDKGGPDKGGRGGEPAKGDNNKDIAALIAAMKKDVAAKKDADAIPKMDQLITKFPDCGPKDKNAIADAIAKNFEATRLPDEGSKEQPKLYMTSVVALGQMGELGSKHLQAAYENKEWKRDAAFRGKILQMIGTTKDPNAVTFLTKKLEDKEYTIVADSSAALGNFSSAKEDVRKPIVEKLVKSLNSAQGAAADPSTPNGAEAKRRFETIAPSMIDSLQKLTNQTFREPREWEKWWNNNKQKPWA